MIKIIIRTLSVALLVLTSGAAVGQDGNGQGGNGNGQGSNGQGGNGGTGPYYGAVAAPEIDPAAAISALMLLAGTVAIIRGYRRNSTP